MLSISVQNLLSFLREQDKKTKQENLETKVNLKTSVGMFAFVYEKLRNLVDYQEEHQLLRRAITRILVRRVKTDNNPKYLVNNLVTELLMARYLLNGHLSEKKVIEIENILHKFFLLNKYLKEVESGNKEGQLDFLLSLAAREIEEIIIPSSEDQLISFALNTLEERSFWVQQGEEEEKRAKLLIGLQRSLSGYDERTIYYKLWKIYFPEWSKSGEEKIAKIAGKFTEADQIIQKYLKDPEGSKIVRILKKHLAPYKILRDLINKDFSEVEYIFSSPESLSKAAVQAANSRYRRAIALLRRSAVNSFVYIFITKMVFALALEIPYELYFSSRVNYLPIVINLLFPPALMLFIALTVESPSEANTQKIINEIDAMVFPQNGLDQLRFDLKERKSAFLTKLFGGLYLFAFLLTFGITLVVLKKFHFSLMSMMIFFFFLSTVSFFAFRIRSSFKELVVGEEGANLVSIIFDFFMLPFIKLGRIISSSLSEINIFIFIFDIIIEAPFKLVLEVIEEWVKFLREKKEEVLNVIK